MKKLVSIMCVLAILSVLWIMPGYASDNYRIMGSDIVDDDTAVNEVIFGDNFNRTSDINTDGHPKDLLWAETASSHHGMAWLRGVKPASTAQYLGTWSYTAKSEASDDNYLRMETGSETTSKTAAHILYISPDENTFAGSDSESKDVYVIECDILPGTSDCVEIFIPSKYMYTDGITPIHIAGSNATNSKTYDVRFNPSEWHHVMAIVDEVNSKYSFFIDGEHIKTSAFDATQNRTKGVQLRISANLISNTYCGIDNFVVRKAGNRELVFDGVLYNEEKNNATYANKGDSITTGNAVYLNKLVINESETARNYTFIGATYDGNTLKGIVPYSVTIEPYGYYHYYKTFYNMSNEVSFNLQKAKLFVWNEDFITPVVECDEFLKSTVN